MKKVPGIGSIFTAEEWKDEPYEVQESLKSDNLMKSILFRKMELESHLDMKKRHIKDYAMQVYTDRDDEENNQMSMDMLAQKIREYHSIKRYLSEMDLILNRVGLTWKDIGYTDYEED